MDFDFNLVLVPLTLILGAVWLLDILVFKQRKTRGKGKESLPVSWAYDFFPVLAVVLVVRSFILEPFNIPSSSMVPTLYTGDFIVVNKSAYGVKLPLTNTKVIDTGSPQHGDVAVFRYPKNPKIYYIKRVIGLPGDEVVYSNGNLVINGQQIDTSEVSFEADSELTNQLYPAGETILGHQLTADNAAQLGQQEEAQAIYFQELQGRHKHLVRYLHDVTAGYPQDSWRVTVPDGNYFVMGDNRDRSKDSRSWKFVPEANLAGKAVYVWMHKKPGLTNLPSFSRNGAIE